MINEALDTCIRLNQWDKAVEISEKYHLSNASDLLNKYAGNQHINIFAFLV